MDVLTAIGDGGSTAVGFFWKSGWAFVLGYAISAMLQAFVPREAVMRHLGSGSVRSIGLATLFGAVSSSCSFAALATARTLVQKGAHFREAVAFMFASTNLVIELGILIVIFLGWPYLVAELIGGFALIAIVSVLMAMWVPAGVQEEARQRASAAADGDDGADASWSRAGTLEGWRAVGRHFVGEWAMVWEEITIGFTAAGFIAVLVPDTFWQTAFLANADVPTAVQSVENAFVGPVVAMATFIGSMGNIPLATVLAGSGVSFAGVMAFIYSDLVVPPLIVVNARYYGWRAALWIAALMYVSIVGTALLLAFVVSLAGITPEPTRVVEELTRFSVDYTFWLNLVFSAAVVALGWLALAGEQGLSPRWPAMGVKRGLALALLAVDVVGLAMWALG